MFCEKCGTKNTEDAAFCEHCGEKLGSFEKKAPPVSETVPNNPNKFVTPIFRPSTRPVKKMSVMTKIGLTALILLIVAAVAFFFVGKMMHSPERTLEKYMDALCDMEYGNVYDCYSIEESDFINKEAYVGTMERITDPEYIRSYEYQRIKKFHPTKIYYDVVLELNNGYTKNIAVDVEKQAEKSLFIFNTYKIAPENLVRNDYRITVPYGAELYINGEPTAKKYIEKTEDYKEIYLIPEIFMGPQRIRIVMPYAHNFETTENITNTGSFSKTSLAISSDSRKEITEKAQDFVNRFILTAINGGEITELSDFFVEDGYTDYVNSEFNKIKEKVFNDENFRLKDFSFVKFDTTLPEEYEPGTTMQVYTNFEYNHTIMRKAGGSFKEYTPEEPSRAGIRTYFVYESGKWKIKDIGSNFYL